MQKNKLKELRKKENMTQKDIASLIGTSQRAYQNYESGRRTPPLQIAVKLGNIFMCDVGEIFFSNEHCKMQCDNKTTA